jgi:hypothetical protein
MGKRNRAREARRRQHDDVVWTVLKSHSELEKVRALVRAPAACFDDFGSDYRKKVAALRGYALRAPTDWRCRIKSRSEEKRFLDLVRFSFARYRVAPHLEQAWIAEIDDDFVDRIVAPNPADLPRTNAPDMRRWYLVAAQGGSLYRQEAHRWLSKQECHHFLTAPAGVGSLRQAMWYAVARAQTESREAALKVARSKVAGYSIASTWWKEAARFFARNPIAVHEIDDLVDFLFVARQEDAAFTLKGRTLATLRRRMEDWHARCARARRSAAAPGPAAPCPTPTTRPARNTTARSGASGRSRPGTSCSARASACTTASRATSSRACRGTCRSGR